MTMLTALDNHVSVWNIFEIKFICTLYTVNKVPSVFFWTSSTVKIKTRFRHWLYFCLQVQKSAYQVGP